MKQWFIDANAYAEKLWKLRMNYQMLDDTYTADKIMHGIFRAEQELKEQPIVDVVPLVHSRWIWVTEDKYRCENCGDDTRVDEVMEVPKYEWCPFCGARMDQKMIR